MTVKTLFSASLLLVLAACGNAETPMNTTSNNQPVRAPISKSEPLKSDEMKPYVELSSRFEDAAQAVVTDIQGWAIGHCYEADSKAAPQSALITVVMDGNVQKVIVLRSKKDGTYYERAKKDRLLDDGIRFELKLVAERFNPLMIENDSLLTGYDRGSTPGTSRNRYYLRRYKEEIVAMELNRWNDIGVLKEAASFCHFYDVVTR